MNRSVYQYTFAEKIPFEDVEESLLLAVLVAESLHGRSALRMCTSFYLEREKRSVAVDGDSQVGEHIARIFTGLLTQEFGEEAFRVTRCSELKKEADPERDGEERACKCRAGVSQ
jgi:hypothetical protein